VRELRNLIERIVLIEDDDLVRARHLPAEMLQAPGPGTLTSPALGGPGVAGGAVFEGAHDGDLRTLREVEEEHILRVLRHHGGNKSHASRTLGLSRQGLIERLKKVRSTDPLA